MPKAQAIILVCRVHNCEEVGDGLSDYLTRASSIVQAHGGVVTGFFNGAFFAVWTDWAQTAVKGDDAFNAVGACLALREDLGRLNGIRMSRKQAAIRIGMGLDSGRIFGCTVGAFANGGVAPVGAGLNSAMQFEALTVEHSVDLLISADVFALAKDDFIYDEKSPSLFGVKGFYDEQGKQVIIETPYSSLAKANVDTDATPPNGTVAPAGEGNFIDPELLNQASLPGHWFIKINNEVFGPYSKEEIIAGLNSTELQPSMFACADLNNPVWAPLGDLDDFKELCKAA